MTTTEKIVSEKEPAGLSTSRAIAGDLERLYANTDMKRRSCLRPRGDEFCSAVYRAETTGAVVIVFTRRYGLEPGIRTVVLSEKENGQEYGVLADAFAPGQSHASTGRGALAHRSIFTVEKTSEKPATYKASVPAPPAPIIRPLVVQAPWACAWPETMLFVPVYGPGLIKPSGWHIEFCVDSIRKATVGAFTLADLEVWLDARASITGAASGLLAGERILKVA